MKVIGITGGIGSGKSKVLEFIAAESGAVVCQADLVAHELQKPGQICYNKIIDCFGRCILDDEENIDRGKLGRIVFHDKKKLEMLNRIVHPEVKRTIRQKIKDEKNRGTRLFVIEAALLIEDHYDMICDEMWYIYARDEIRKQRLKQFRNYDDEKVEAILASQSSDQLYRRHCKYVIDNSGAFEDTIRQIRNLGEQIK